MEQAVASLKGVGESRARAFEKQGVHTLRDLLYYLPRDYEDYSTLSDIPALRHGQQAALRLRVIEPPKFYAASGLKIVSARAQCDTGSILLAWFNQPYRRNQIKVGEELIYYGRVDMRRGMRLINPGIAAGLPGILPVYPLVSGLSQYHVRAAMKQAAALALQEMREELPLRLRERYGLCGIQEALHGVHFPTTHDELREARYRLSFEDMLYYLLVIAMMKRERKDRTGIAFDTETVKDAFIATLPYPLTAAQSRVIDEIAQDMRGAAPMNRLVQGDVGAGKTALAFYALRVAAKNGFQGALMAPTEVLARQHYALLVAEFGAQAALLHSGMRKKERDDVYARIASGEAKYIVGTHALLQPGLVYHRLGLVVTDEQHRFGVRQRAQLAGKSDVPPDVLVMSATPIPRTLAMLLYGDLDLSVLDEMPPHRKPTITRPVPMHKRNDMYRFIEKQAKDHHRQAYVVCPLIEQSEALTAKSAQEVYKELTAALDVRIALLHGRMAATKKEEILSQFRAGEIDILVSTTVVEVGIDVKNATAMVVENADRFGLAQLHQLRGRVGRGDAQSFAFLLCGSGGEAAEKRMQIMKETNDGFLIAQKDLELRGPGEFLGTRQHGTDGLYAAKLASNMDVLLQAQAAADALMREGETGENAALFERAKGLYEKRMQDIANN